MDANGRFEVTYNEVTDGRPPVTIIKIRMSERLLLSYRALTGRVLNSELQEPLPTPFAETQQTLPSDIRSIPDIPRVQIRMLLMKLFCELGVIESEEELLLRVRHVLTVLLHEASKVNKAKEHVVDAVVHYHYFVRSLRMVEVCTEDTEPLDGDAVCNYFHQLGDQQVSLNRQETTVQECWLCFLDSPDGMPVTQLHCHHQFHQLCLAIWMQRSKLCPLCLHRPPVTASRP